MILCYVRNEIIEWNKEATQLAEKLMGYFSLGLGVKEDKLKELSCGEGRVMVGHYYPYCPEPNKTIGIASHTDPGILTVLLQDQVGGLQVKYDGKWVNVKPVHGALVINVGDLLQVIISFFFSYEIKFIFSRKYLQITALKVRIFANYL